MRKIKPSVAWDDEETCPTADGRDAQSSDNQTNRLLDLQRDELGTESVETDSGLTEESWLRQGPLSRGVTQKLCQWFSVTQDAVETNVTPTFSLDKRSTAPSSKKIHKRVKLRWKKSTCTVHSVWDENSDPDYSSGHSGSSTAARTVVSLCLPPGCIFSEVISQVSTNQRVVYRRNAICEELEMITGFVKINGAKFSLWHLRAELQNNKNRERLSLFRKSTVLLLNK